MADDQAGKVGACPRCGGSFQTPDAFRTTPYVSPSQEATQSPDGTSAEFPAKASVEVPGYEILGELGRGGMGVIYKAWQLRPRRLVALKMILAGEYAGEAALARFKTEADAVASLSHPNIVQIYEVNEHKGHPYLTLEFIEGGNLAQRLLKTPCDFKETADLVQRLARAIHYAHGRGIIHRDLKPANVLLASGGCEPSGAGESPLGEWIPKITDFGLAKHVGDSASLLSGARTQTGAIMGTPNYMAPEQAEGKSKNVGPAVDVYALGAILYELLTGRPPFLAETTFATLSKVVAEEPVPPRQLRPKCPRDLETICLKCLEKEPAKRYASAGALADDLHHWLDGEPIEARPPGKFERLARLLQRRPVRAFFAAAIVAALLLLGLALSSLSPSKSPKLPKTVAKEDEKPVSVKGPGVEKQRQISDKNLRQLAVAMILLADKSDNYLPPAAITDKRTGKPLLSWRVAILPCLDQNELFDRFKLDEEWDGPNNSKLLSKMPSVYAIEGVKTTEPYTTFYQVFVGPGTAFEAQVQKREPFGFAGLRYPAAFQDGTSNTILIVEAGPCPGRSPSI
jgi:serine/threonine protein kinase